MQLDRLTSLTLSMLFIAGEFANAQLALPVVTAQPTAQQNTLAVTLTESDPTATIYYTLDNSAPTFTSSVFTSDSSINITTGTTLRAWACNGPAASNILSATFVNLGAVSSGSVHSIAVKQDGTVWSWGKNDKGQLGIGDSQPAPSPVQLTYDSQNAPITNISGISVFQSNSSPPDTDNNGIQDWYEYEYFGNIGVNPDDPSPSGDGFTIGEDFEYGLNPTPTVSIIGGGNQIGNAGTMLASPLLLSVDNGQGQQPITVTITQGGASLASVSGGSTSTSVTVTPNLDPNSGLYYASVYLQTAASSSDISTISIAIGGYPQSTTSTTVSSADASVPAPTNLSVVATSPTSASVTWSSDPSAYSVVQQSIDGGNTWQTLAVTSPGTDSYLASNLTGNSSEFRVYSSSSDLGVGDDSLPTAVGNVIFYTTPEIMGKNVTAGLNIALSSIIGLESSTSSSPNYYLTSSITASASGPNTLNESCTITTTYDPSEPLMPPTTTTSGDPAVFYQVTANVVGKVNSDTDETWNYSKTYSNGTVSYTATYDLSDQYTTSMMDSLFPGVISAFPPDFTPNTNEAIYHSDAYTISVQELQYEFVANEDTYAYVAWDDQFTPEDGGPVTDNIQYWDGGSSPSSQVYTLDLKALQQGPNGRHNIWQIPIAMYPRVIPSSGVARAQLDFTSQQPVPAIGSSFSITIGGTEVTNIHQDEMNPRIIYFTVPPGAAGYADVTISGIALTPGGPGAVNIPNIGDGSNTALTLPAMVQYTNDPTLGMKGFSDSDAVCIQEGQDYMSANINSIPNTTTWFGEMRDTYAALQMPLFKSFFSNQDFLDADLAAMQERTDAAIEDMTPAPAAGTASATLGVGVLAVVPDAYFSGPSPGTFEFTAPLSPQDTTIYYSIAGTAVSGTDFTPLTGSVTIPAGQTTTFVNVVPINAGLSTAATVVVSVVPEPTYAVSSQHSATVTIQTGGTVQNAVVQNKSLMKALTSIPSIPPTLSDPNFYADVKARLAATGQGVFFGQEYTIDFTPGQIKYVVFPAGNLNLHMYLNQTAGTTINTALSANMTSPIILNGAQCNYGTSSYPNIFHEASDKEPLTPIGWIINDGSLLSQNSSAGGIKTATGRYWLGQNLSEANGTDAESYIFGGPGNPSGITSGLGGMVSLILSGHSQTSHDDKDLGVYNTFHLSTRYKPSLGDSVGFNVIGVNRANGMVIVLTKANGPLNSGYNLFDIQSMLSYVGTDTAMVTDGGDSTAMWYGPQGFLSLAARHSSTPDATNTVSNYILFNLSN